MATNYMATHAKHLNTKFADEPCSSNCSWSQQEHGCLDASKSRQMFHFSQGLKSFEKTDRKGIPDFQKNIHQQVLNKCPFSNSFYAFRN